MNELKARGRRSREKGARGERTIVRLLNENGFPAKRIGAAYVPGPDISVELLGVERLVEVKSRAHFKQLHDWLAEADILVLRADRKEPLVVIQWRLALEIARAR